MKKISISILLLSIALASGSAFAYSCPAKMNAIDAQLAEAPSLSQGDLDRVLDLRALGEKLHKSGDHDGSVKALQEAMDLLKI